VRVFVRVKSKSKRPGVAVLGDARFVVAVAEPPIDGRANRAVAAALAEHFGVPVSTVMLVAGASSRDKVFDIDDR
jgi:uncharacterized protein